MTRKFVIILMISFGALFLGACVGGPIHGSTWPGLAADNNTAYLADGPFVYGIDLSNGKEIWKYPAQGGEEGMAFYSTPAVTPEGLVIIGSAGTEFPLVAINPKDINTETNTPAVAWRFDGARDRWMAAPLVVEDTLFAANSDGNLYIFDLQDGRSVKQPAKVVDLGERLWSQPTTDGERVYLTTLDHSVVAVDVNTYEVLWNEDLGGAVPGSAVLSEDGTLYVGSLASRLEKFDPASGDRQTVLDAKNWVWGTPALAGDTLYFADVDGNFYSVNTSTGSLNWSVQPDGPITASPLIREDHVLLATESGSVFAIGADGQTVWTEEIGGKIYTTPVAAGDNVLVASLETDYYLTALGPDGRQVWTFTPGE